jgi:hypothetical protein
MIRPRSEMLQLVASFFSLFKPLLGSCGTVNSSYSDNCIRSSEFDCWLNIVYLVGHCLSFCYYKSPLFCFAHVCTGLFSLAERRVEMKNEVLSWLHSLDPMTLSLYSISWFNVVEISYMTSSGISASMMDF